MSRFVRQSSLFYSLVAGLLSLVMASTALASFATELTHEQIEQVLESYFTLNEYAAFARVSMHKPQVRLQKGEQNVVLIVPVVANVAGDGVQRGHAMISVSLAYKPPSGGLYFSQPRIEQFDMPGVDKKTLASLREIVHAMNLNSLPLVRIYAVKERDLNHSLGKSALKSSIIEDNRLKLLFGFD